MASAWSDSHQKAGSGMGNCPRPGTREGESIQAEGAQDVRQPRRVAERIRLPADARGHAEPVGEVGQAGFVLPAERLGPPRGWCRGWL